MSTSFHAKTMSAIHLIVKIFCKKCIESSFSSAVHSENQYKLQLILLIDEHQVILYSEHKKNIIKILQSK